MTSDERKGFEIVMFLARRGYRVEYRPQSREIDISPAPSDERLAERIVANETVLVLYLNSLDGRPATGHRFVAPKWESREAFRDRGACIACGAPWLIHGEPAIAHWHVVEDVRSVRSVSTVPLRLPEESAVPA